VAGHCRGLEQGTTLLRLGRTRFSTRSMGRKRNRGNGGGEGEGGGEGSAGGGGDAGSNWGGQHLQQAAVPLVAPHPRGDAVAVAYGAHLRVYDTKCVARAPEPRTVIPIRKHPHPKTLNPEPPSPQTQKPRP